MVSLCRHRKVAEVQPQPIRGDLRVVHVVRRAYQLRAKVSASCCSRSFWYSRSLGLLAPVIHGMMPYIQEQLEIGRSGSMGRRSNGNTLAAVNVHLRPLRESVAYGRDVGVGVPTTVII
jgi:hypothetical protein